MFNLLLAVVQLGAPFNDGMVLQRGVKCPVWGGADAGERVTVSFAGQTKTAIADAQGAWRVDLEPMTASAEGRVLTANGVAIKDVLVGEVWFASGQSNMDCPVWGNGSRYRDANGGLVTAMANQPLVRLVKTPLVWSTEKRKLKAEWFKMTAKDLKARNCRISAAGYYFARELHLALGVPVGLIDSSWGGTNIDAWTPRCGYDGCADNIKCVAELPIFKTPVELLNSITNGAHAKYPGSKTIYGTAAKAWPNQQPTVLWQGMVADYCPFAIKGFIWYQGCHNSGEPQLYCAKLHALHNGWKRAFDNSGLKLYLVQLAPWKNNWNAIAAAQNKFVDEEPNAAISVVSDWGNFSDIHPSAKEIVGKRLVVHALKRDYGFDIPEDDSPTFKAVEFKDGQAIVDFNHVRQWYVYNADFSFGAPFQLAGADGKWYAAEIKNYRQHKTADGKTKRDYFIDGSKLILGSAKVAAPVKVRYMGEPRTMSVVYNEMSLPLGPFETK